MLKKLLLLVLVVAPMTIFAQGKIAHINANDIFAKMPEVADVQTKLAAKSETLQKNAQAIEDEYTALIQKFQSDTTAVTAAIVSDREKQVMQLRERYENFLQTSQVELEQERQKELAPIQQKLQGAIKKVGDANGYQYIADSAVFLYISPSSEDASNKVQAELDKK